MHATAMRRKDNQRKRKICCREERKWPDRASLERSEKNGEESYPSQPANARHSDEKKRKLEEAETILPRGKKMVRASLHRSKKNVEEDTVTREALRRKVHASAKPKESDNTKLWEINAANLTRTAAAKSIGSGTFGTCYLGKYWGIDIVIKQYKERSCRGGECLSFLQREAKHEASVLLRLGDHPDIPLLFDERLHAVIIDFGKSVLLIKAKNPPAKPMHVRDQYKDSYIAPELVDGTGKPSIKSDIYALSFLIKSVYRLLHFRNVAAVKNALVTSPEERPTIKELKAALSADD